MAPSSKARAAGVSASSFLDLKAELAKQESDFGKKGARAGGVPRAEKKEKGTVWARTNKVVAARAARDIEALAADRQTAESARAALERKAAIYDKLRKGKTGGLSDAQFDALLVDFDSKGVVEEHFSSDSEDVDESLTVPKGPAEEDDPLVEYEDEFGRLRTARRSEVPRDLMPSAQAEEEEEYDPFVVHNPVNHFPIFEQSAERVAAIQEAASEAANPLATHYDAAREVRAKGAAFYAFSADEERRAREMEALKRAREETETARQAAGAVDVRPGESEGLTGEPSTEGGEKGKGKGKEAARSRAMEKRKRELEERRKLVEAKRRKVKGGEGNNEAAGPRKIAEPVDPVAAVEAAAAAKAPNSKSRWDQKHKANAPAPSVNSADDFLAQLEHDLVGKT